MSDMKKVMMNDHVEDKKPACGALFGSSGPSSPLSPSSSEPSSIAPSCRRKCDHNRTDVRQWTPPSLPKTASFIRAETKERQLPFLAHHGFVALPPSHLDWLGLREAGAHSPG